MANLGAGYVWLCLKTMRWTVEGKEGSDETARAGPAIAAIWHGRLFFSPVWAPECRRTIAMISNNRDGDLIAAIAAKFGVDSIRGSTYDKVKGRNKGGADVYREAIEWLRAGAVVAISPDGPRGPRMRAQVGIAKIAVETGCPVVPVAFSSRPGKLFNSWDRFLVPFPFARGALIYGSIIAPPTSDDAQSLEALRRTIEEGLTVVANRADDLCGRPCVEPGAPPSPSGTPDGPAGE